MFITQLVVANAGTDLWVNDFLENVVPHLKVRPVLLIHRTKPKGFEDYKFPIETHWQGDDVGEFEKYVKEQEELIYYMDTILQ